MKKLLPMILLGTLATAGPKFSDDQLKAMTPHYFTRNHTAPQLLGVSIYKTRTGRVYRVDIKADRNRSNDDLSFAYSALTTMGQYAKKKFKEFVVVMHYDVRGKTPEVCVGKAKCTLDCFVHNRVSYEKWWKECITFKEM